MRKHQKRGGIWKKVPRHTTQPNTQSTPLSPTHKKQHTNQPPYPYPQYQKTHNPYPIRRAISTPNPHPPF
ncbi:hypothetical protein COCSADRAFT_37825 [Bipolaris sorokiniana ND90Pr]|uniref:Uncharacterized protein n=1 Tax=Cochliobolus sativus (strain ND90Pr / ATCC 201652) TaxID=665912 RepID=M2T154_COCSN|nr:uncharacterized protein COCSADRAFT_37825 [Bipolaris sorokiniana ND90Pr]EMD62941.1 hypothetical protein COCSADRAFT_37825 [Bipolaris sorokiniana ND90Pr]